MFFISYGIFFIFLIIIVSQGFGLNQEYERAVIFRLGRLRPERGPGWYWLIPVVDRAVKVDMRTITLVLDPQETVTKDGVAVKINAVLWYRVAHATKVCVAVENWRSAVRQAAETALRDTIGQNELDDLLKDRSKINNGLRTTITESCLDWGVEIPAVELRDLDIPETMQRAIAREAEAIRERRARIIKAEGELQAAVTLAEAAQKISGSPGALELRRLQTLAEIGVEHNSTIVVAMPMEAMAGSGGAWTAAAMAKHQPSVG